MLHFYIAVALTAFRRQLIYRWANLAGLLTNIFFGAVFSYVIIALYHARPLAAGYDVHDTLRYTWLIQAMLMAVLPFGWQDLILTIRTGEVVSDLSKPCDFYWYWFSRELGRAVYYLLFRGLPIYAAGMLLFGIGLPDDWHVWLIYGWTLSLGIMLGVAYRYLYNIVAFWIVEARAMVTFAQTIGLFFTGSYVPLPLFPTWLRTIADWLPFNGLMNVPTEVFLGKLSGGSLWFELGRQALWLMVFTFVVRTMTTTAARHVVAQGG